MFIDSAKAVQIGHKLMPNSLFGAMYAMSELYPKTCKPEDMFYRLQARRENWFYIDIMGRGYYPSYAQGLLKRHNAVMPDMTEEDRKDLFEGQLDFISISYYRSSITEAGDS